MRRLLLPALLSCALGLWPNEGRAQPLPAPRPLPPAFVPPPSTFPPPPPFRRSAYEIWQYYGINNTGWFLPLVIDDGFGGVYRSDGTPYTGISTHMINYMPYGMDSPGTAR
jgi:hypothetical protein